MKQLKHFERIHAYAEGQMDKSQQAAFEAELLADADLRAEFDAFKASQKAMEVLAFDALGELAGEEKKESKTVPIWRRGWVQAAAVLLLVSAVAWMFWPTDVPLSPEQLARNYYLEPNLSPIRGVENPPKVDLAAISFELGEMEKAISLASSIHKDSLDFQTAQFILGHAYFKTGQAILAESAFAKVTTGEHQENAEWSRAMAKLAAGQINEAKELLMKISNKKGGGFSNMAEELLKDLASR